MKLIILLLSLFSFSLFNYLQSQQCNCAEYQTLKQAFSREGGDLTTYTAKLYNTGNIVCKARAEEWQAMEYLLASSFDSAEICLKKAEKLYRQTRCGDSLLMVTYKTWAQLYYTKNDFSKAQDFSFRFLTAAEAAGNAYETGVCYTMIAQLFNQTKQPEMGIVYARKAVPLINKVNDPVKKADLLFKLSKRFLWHYQDVKAMTSLDSSEIFSLEQLAIARSINRRSSIAAAFSNLQGIAWERGDLQKALYLLDSSFTYTDKDDWSMLATNFFDKADIYIELKDLKNAALMADSALKYRLKDSNQVYIGEAYALLSRIKKESGDFKTAMEYKELSDHISDSLTNVEQAKTVSELEKQYNQAKNEKKISELAQQKRIYVLLAAVGLFALIGLIFFIRQQSLKNKQKILETEQRLNRARMNPHFFFNALSSLQSYALDGNDGKSIATNLSKFSHIMRETLESTYKEYVTIEQESDFLKEYLELQKMRFPQKFSYDVHIDQSISQDDTLIPSMILQPFAENSIEHGFTGIDYPGHLAIYFENKDRDLLIRIVDNGKGLTAGPKENSEHISRASQIIRDRIYLLNVKLKTKASFTIDNNENEKGVSVFIRLPLLYKQELRV